LPSKRFGHVAVAVGGAILAFGGATSSDRAPISELYRINMGAATALYSTTDFRLVGGRFVGDAAAIVKMEVDTRASIVAFDCADMRFTAQPSQLDLQYWHGRPHSARHVIGCR